MSMRSSLTKIDPFPLVQSNQCDCVRYPPCAPPLGVFAGRHPSFPGLHPRLSWSVDALPRDTMRPHLGRKCSS
jgi:hypothetical protein